MSTMYSDLITIREASSTLSQSEPDSWFAAHCDSCNSGQMGVVAQTNNHATYWLRCPICRNAYVWNGNVLSPSIKPLSIPQGIPPLELSVWKEIRECLSVGASTAAVMLCRKLLLHIAITHGLDPKTDKYQSPTFYAAVEHLQASGLITPKMRKWVDRIKDVGNEANHELMPISLELAMDVSIFTEQLLRLTFEMDELMLKSGVSESEKERV
jgi:hypothetical protein